MSEFDTNFIITFFSNLPLGATRTLQSTSLVTAAALNQILAFK